MPRESFDIKSLLNFKPAEYLCEKCFALLTYEQIQMTNWKWACPICGVEYMPLFYGLNYTTDQPPSAITVAEYLVTKGLTLHVKDLPEHAERLAALADLVQRHLTNSRASWEEPFPPMRALFTALLSAEHFVHFTTFGISRTILGALKMASQRVPIRGIISNASYVQGKELTEYSYEAPRLDVRYFRRSTKPTKAGAAPHQKLIIVDGLLAFTGSTNLTDTGLRNAEQGRDNFECVTDVGQVTALNNRFFSPIWAEFDTVQSIVMQR